MMFGKRLLVTFAFAAIALTFCLTAAATSSGTPGVSARSIKIGGTFPFSGPASLYAGVGRGQAAYFQYVNDRGGVNGRKIEFVTLDDAYNPANTVQLTRRLVEQEKVLAVVGSLGTEANLATRSYLNGKGIPQVLLSTGASTWGSDYRRYPWTIGWQPNYIAEGYIYGRFIISKVPQAKIAILHQNDAYGEDYIAGLKKGLGAKQNTIVETEGYEPTSSDVASQIVKLKASGANTLFVAATPTFAVQAVVLAYKLGWRPTIFLNSIAATDTLMALAAKSANAEAVNGIISVQYWMDPADAKYAKPGAIDLYRSIMAKHNPEGNVNDAFNVYGMAQAWTFVDALRRAGKTPTRASLMKAILSIDTKDNPFLLPGMRMFTSPKDRFPLNQGVLIRYENGGFKPFGRLLTYPRAGR
jgi:branched-chain amino acid transport system substrate-binding protein